MKKSLIWLGFMGLAGAIALYFMLPALTVFDGAMGYWMILVSALYVIPCLSVRWTNNEDTSIIDKIVIGSAAVITTIFILGCVISSKLFNAKDYSAIAEPSIRTANVSDLPEINLDNLITVDKDTAIRLGARKMGTLADIVSQYEVDNTYTQINYNGKAYRVSPLKYGSIFKWASNPEIPGYIMVDVVTGQTEYIPSTIKYSTSGYFGEDLYRMVRKNFLTTMFDYEPAFEVDDCGHPYWVYHVFKNEICLFGGKNPDGIILVDAETGEMTRYLQNEIPEWIDHAIDGDLVLEQLDWNGAYKSGIWNYMTSQKGCTSTTDGYGYILGNNDVYLYTGITSVASDESNIGFVLVNMRTKQISKIEYPSAEEYSAMSTAEGKIQEKGYKASFPVLYRKGDKLVYFLSLKDDAGLVKSYAFVDAADYTKVIVSESIESAWAEILKWGTSSPETEWSCSTIADIEHVIVNGNSMYYIIFDDDNTVYSANVLLSKRLPFIKEGDELNYIANGDIISLIK